MAIEKIIDVKVQSESAETAVKSLRTQFREAQQDVAELSAKFGATSDEAVKAAKRASELKDQIGDAKALTDAFNPDAKFKSLTSSLAGVAGGFSAVQGAMGLVGTESESVEKTLLKVQSAMALSTGLQQLGESADAFKQLKAVALNALNSIKTAIGSTGIGLLVIALGAVYAYWDDIKEAVSGVSEEQKQLNLLSDQNFETEKAKLETIGNQDNILKLQGKTEKEILQIKIKQTDETIKDGEIRLKNQIASNKMAFDAETRNKEILQRLMRFGIEMSILPIRALLAPLDLVIKTANKVADVLGFEKITSLNIQDEITKLTKLGSDKLSTFVFDPAKVKAEGDKTIAEQQKYLEKLKNDRAGLQNQVNAIDKKASNDAEQKRKDKAEKEAQELQKQKDALKAIEEKAIDDVEDLKAKSEREKLELQKQRDLEELDAIKLSEEEKAKARQAILEKYRLLNLEQDQKDAEEKTAKDIEKNQKSLDNQSLSFEERKTLLDEQEKIIDEGVFKTEEDRTKAKEANAKARIELDKLESKAKMEALDAVSNTLASASDLLGKETEAGKALSVASATISTFVSAQKAYEATIGIPFVGPTLAPINAGLAVLSGLKNIKSILAVKVPNSSGGGASAPSIPSFGGGATASAPQFNVVGDSGTNQLASSLGGALKQSPVQAYVVASDVSSAQSLNRNIIQNASLG